MTSYGAVETKEPTEDVESAENFDTSNMYYVKERSLNTTEKVRKLLTTVVPLVIAVVLMGLFAAWAMKAIGPSGGEISHRDHSRPASFTPPDNASPAMDDLPAIAPASAPKSVPTNPKTPPSSSSSSTTTTDSSSTFSSGGSSADAACSAHPACGKLGLIGDCCPSAAGTNLDCCS